MKIFTRMGGRGYKQPTPVYGYEGGVLEDGSHTLEVRRKSDMDGRVIGQLIFKLSGQDDPAVAQNGRSMEIGWMHVPEEEQGKGIAKKLMSRAVIEAYANGVRDVSLTAANDRTLKVASQTLGPNIDLGVNIDGEWKMMPCLTPERGIDILKANRAKEYPHNPEGGEMLSESLRLNAQLPPAIVQNTDVRY